MCYSSLKSDSWDFFYQNVNGQVDCTGLFTYSLPKKSLYLYLNQYIVICVNGHSTKDLHFGFEKVIGQGHCVFKHPVHCP